MKFLPVFHYALQSTETETSRSHVEAWSQGVSDPCLFEWRSRNVVQPSLFECVNQLLLSSSLTLLQVRCYVACSRHVIIFWRLHCRPLLGLYCPQIPLVLRVIPGWRHFVARRRRGKEERSWTPNLKHLLWSVISICRQSGINHVTSQPTTIELFVSSSITLHLECIMLIKMNH